MTQQRHSWSEPVRFIRKTERTCNHCGIVRVTRHEEEIWSEFWRDGVQLKTNGVRAPVCDVSAKPKAPPAPVPALAHNKSPSEHSGPSA